PRLARVAGPAGAERASLVVGREVRAPTGGEPPDPPGRRLGRHRVIAAAHAEPDGNGPLDRHRVQPSVIDPMELAPEVDDLLRPQKAHHLDLLGATPAAVLEPLVERLALDRVPPHADPQQ